jgi:hypothetical protein
MCLLGRLLRVSLLATALVVACADVDSAGVSVLMRVVEHDGETNDLPPIESVTVALPALGGVEICENTTANCVVTTPDGQAILLLPNNEEVSYTLTKDGYAPNLQAEATSPAAVGVPTSRTISPRVTMWSDELRSKWFERLLSPFPQRGTGTIYVFTNPAIEGVTFELVGATGKRFYEAALDDPRLDLQSTTPIGTGGFVEVSPGEFRIEFGGTVSQCAAIRAWPGDTTSRIRVPVRAGYFTVASVACAKR